MSYKTHDASWPLTNAQESALTFVRSHPGCGLRELYIGAGVGEVPLQHLRRKGLVRVEGFTPGDNSKARYFATESAQT